MTESGKPTAAQQLFQQTRIDSQARSDALLRPEVFPLGQFSQFVLLRQPELLRGIREGATSINDLYREQEEQLDALLPSDMKKLLLDPQQIRVALLDTGFAISAITFSGGEPSERLLKLNRQLAEAVGLSESMTFQKIVTINSTLPYEAMRTFTDGETRNTERDFYYGHALMNAPLEVATVQTQQVRDLLRRGNIDEADELLHHIGASMQKFAAAMSEYNRHMDPIHFKTFRQYIARYPDGTPNASGAYIGMPRLQLRLTGSSNSYDQFLEKAMTYFSPEDKLDIHVAQQELTEGSLIDLCEQLPVPQRIIIARVLLRTLQQLQSFRERHYAAVMKFVPEMKLQEEERLRVQLQQPEEELKEEIGEDGLGTGGFPGGPLLRNIMRLNKRGIQRLETLLQGYERRQI